MSEGKEKEYAGWNRGERKKIEEFSFQVYISRYVHFTYNEIIVLLDTRDTWLRRDNLDKTLKLTKV